VGVRPGGRASELEHEWLAMAARPLSNNVGDDAGIVVGVELE
jgi:hypothetical protein